ncbi:hypothetical protein [Qipengyuania sp. DGS5-3]|uniref:hypothetical protein n=1 Tax=Qipengyuania sp. DGS5-3 TaxID=3349632 RepID=UPI0036D2EA0B
MKLQLCAKSLFAGLLVGLATPSIAQVSDQRVTDRDPDAVDVARTPLKDLNLAKDEIPPVLIDAASAPYSTQGLGRCRALIDEVRRLDAVLGPDLDVATDEEKNITAGKVAQSVVGGLIPFRGLLREATGAADRKRRFEQAILAGAVRRGFLKGIGQQRGCAFPGRPARR